MPDQAPERSTSRLRALTGIAGLPEIQKLEQKYGLPKDQRAGL